MGSGEARQMYASLARPCKGRHNKGTGYLGITSEDPMA